MDADSFTGRQLDRYQIETPVGQGGMGTVYRAWDVQLRRLVALKILNPESDRFAEMRARLLVEARSVAALNHPNIVTIYEIGRAESLDYIAMEFIEGRTLHAVIGGKPLPLELAVKYGLQIADAVAAAHAAGITHRDLKPANVMIGDRHRVKVLDFGLAKAEPYADESSDTRTMVAITQHGTAVGTPGYMSPEQAQGKPMDSRSDVFSLGAMLYEMFTGNRAFPGDNLAAILAAILMLDPPPISSIRPVPPELENLVARCLHKDIARRAQTAEEVRDILQAFAADSGVFSSPAVRVGFASGLDPSQASIAGQPGGAPVSAVASAGAITAVPSDTQQRRRWPYIAVASVLAVALAAGWYLWKLPPSNPFAGAELFRLTNDPGLTWSPTLSRDGKLIAYASDRGNLAHLQIWVQQVGGGAPIQITSGDVENSDPHFSPDGSRIAFRCGRDGGGICVIPALGGESRLLAKGGRNPRFSPDGRQIAFSTVGASYFGKVFLVNVNGNPQPRPFHPEFPSASSPVWSPDGKSILFGVSGQLPDGANETDWWIAPVAGGDAKPTGGFQAMRNLGFWPEDPAEWLAGDRLLLGATRESAASLWLLNLPAAGRPLTYPTRLTFGTSTDQDPAVSGDSHGNIQMAFASVEKHIELWVAPIDANRGVITGPMSPLTEERTDGTQLTVSADGNRIVFLSSRAGSNVPWVRDMRTGRLFSVTSPGVLWSPYISPDGRSVAWGVYENRVITKALRATIHEDGQIGIPETLCEDCGPIGAWSPDGRKIVYSYGRPNRAALFELDTGKRYDLLVKPDMDVWGGIFSPDGQWVTMTVVPPSGHARIYVARFNPEQRQPIPFDEWIPITDAQAWESKQRWAPDGKSMYFVSERDGFRCIWRQPLDPSTKRPAGAAVAVMHFHGARRSLRNVGAGPLAIQVTKTSLIFSLGDVTGNIWLLRRQRKD